MAIMPGRSFHFSCAIFMFLCVRLIGLSRHAIASGLQGSTPNTTAAIRLWLDSAFFSQGEVEIIKDIASHSSGRLVVSGETHTSFLSTKGAYIPQSWDLYWTVRRACHSVLGAIAPPKRVNCVPGVESVAYKQPLIRTMQEAYGEAAFSYIPRSYVLPSQYWVWRSWTRLTASPAELPWVLKANEHRGRGVHVLRQWRAQRQALRGAGLEQDTSVASATQPGFVLIQSYVRQQFLYDNRPSYLRLWVVVTSVEPLRAYLFRGGVLVFGDRVGGETRAKAKAGGAPAGSGNGGDRGRQLLETQRSKSQDAKASGAAGRRSKYETHKVNYWTIEGEKMQPWTVDQLRRHAVLSVPSDPWVWDRTWTHARTSIGMVLAAAARRMRTAARGLSALEGCGFEVLGVDFLLNATFHPTLVEVNALPSLARLRTTPGDPGRDAMAAAASSGNITSDITSGGDSTATRSETAETAASSGVPPALAPFDQEKERFLHHTLRLIGMPLGPPPVRASIPPGTAATAGPPDTAAASVGGALRCVVALLRPPHNDTWALQAFLRTHRPVDFTAAEGLLPALRPLLCPVPAAWGPAPGWPTLEEREQKEKAAEQDAEKAAEQGQGTEQSATAVDDSAARAGGALALAESLAGAAASRRLNAVQSGAVLDELLSRLDGGSLGGRRKIRSSSARTGGDGGSSGRGVVLDELQRAAVAAAAVQPPPFQSRCFEWDALAAIADTQHELEQELDFDPVFSMAAARDLNGAALKVAQMATGAAGTGTSKATADAAGEAAGGSVGGPSTLEGGAGSGNGMEGPQSRFQALTTGLGFVGESILAVNMDLISSIQYMTTKPYVLAKARLPYGRLDATLTAYEAVRRRSGSCVGVGGEGKGTVGGAGAAVSDVSSCALRVLKETLDGLCTSGGWRDGGQGTETKAP